MVGARSTLREDRFLQVAAEITPADARHAAAVAAALRQTPRDPAGRRETAGAGGALYGLRLRRRLPRDQSGNREGPAKERLRGRNPPRPSLLRRPQLPHARPGTSPGV